MKLQLQSYLQRIGYRGPLDADERTLTAVHRSHVRAIAYENLDVQLGRPVSIDVERAYEKIVLERRGGWCYEMNGLLGWALREIGFDVTLLAAGVLRETFGDRTLGGHLALLVKLDEPWLADVGFGDGLAAPVVLTPGAFAQGPLNFNLERLDADYWRFHNHPEGGAASFDFSLAPAQRELLGARCTWLQSSPDSPFVQNAVCQIHIEDGVLMLRGRVLKSVTQAGVSYRTLTDEREYREVLQQVFGLEIAHTPALWARILAREAERRQIRNREET